MNIRKPRAIPDRPRAATIGLSAPCHPEMFKDGLEVLGYLGVVPVIPFDPCESYFDPKHLFSAGSVDTRLSALNLAVNSSDIDFILAARGGYGAGELLEYLDWETLARLDKPIVGVSDSTSLINLIFQRTGIVTFHGPAAAAGFARAKSNEQDLQNCKILLSLLRGELNNPFKETTLEHLCGRTECEGRIVGGNLTILQTLLATPFELNFNDKIVFLEDTSEEFFQIHRKLLQLRLAKKFSKAAGVVFGTFFKCGRPDRIKPSLKDVILDIFKDANIPVFSGLPVGHGPENYPVPIGAMARVKDLKLELLEPCVL